MVDTFGIKTIKEIADKLNMSEVVLIEKTLEYFDDTYKFETRNDITVEDVMQFLKEAWFEYYIALCDSVYTLKKLADEGIYNKIIDYDSYNAPKNNYTRIYERIKELNLKNHNKDSLTSDTNITIYVPTAKQAREQSRSCRQPQINTIINIIKPVVEKEIVEAINKGLYAVTIARFFIDNEALKVKDAICDISNTEYTYEDFTQAMDTIRRLLIDKGYDVKIYHNNYENGIEVSWKNDY